MAKVGNPYPLFLDGRGALLDSGFIYIGQINKDPTVAGNQYPVWWNTTYSQAAPQPLRTLGGLICHGQNPAFAYVNQADYSMTIQDADGVLVQYIPSFAATGDAAANYQPLDSDLTQISSGGTTAFGRSLLLLANAAALKSATGIPDCVPLAGGTVTGNILRQGGGAHAYWAGAAFTGARLFVSLSTGADPTSQPGDVWFGY